MLANLNRVEVGEGVVEVGADHAKLCLMGASSRRYSDAQLDDTRGLARSHYRWRPPLHLSLHARFSHDVDELGGTAGFGFWNVPLGPGPARLPALPRAIWFFFGSPPHHVPLALGVAGSGWKGSCLDAGRTAALVWAPVAPLALLAMQSHSLYHRLWPRIQRALGISEAEVRVDMGEWHSYELDWGLEQADFRVDGQSILRASTCPRGPLGFVAWIDNQYAIASPRGRFGWGMVDVSRAQWLEIAGLAIDHAPVASCGV
jgi:hypothetical protein